MGVFVKSCEISWLWFLLILNMLMLMSRVMTSGLIMHCSSWHIVLDSSKVKTFYHFLWDGCTCNEEGMWCNTIPYNISSICKVVLESRWKDLEPISSISLVVSSSSSTWAVNFFFMNFVRVSWNLVKCLEATMSTQQDLALLVMDMERDEIK